MGIVNGYCTAEELKARLWPYGVEPDDYDNAVFDQVITAVSRWIDGFCGRRFYTTAADETRYFTAEWKDRLEVGDLVSVSSLLTDEDGDRTYEVTWASTDFDLTPFNAALDGIPYQAIETTPKGRYCFPVGVRKGVKVVGKFGFASAPAEVKEACLLMSERIYKRKDAPFGVAGAPEVGEVRLLRELDVDVKQLLSRWVRLL